MSLSVIHARVDNAIHLRREDLKRYKITLHDVLEPFEYSNPDYYKQQRMGFFAGRTPRKLTLVEKLDDELIFPRGVWTRLRTVMSQRGVILKGVDQTVQGNPVEYHWTCPFKLDPDQTTAVHQMVMRKSGIIIGPCASGKTEIGICTVATIGRRGLVIVPTEAILNGWYDTARERLPGTSVGRLFGKKKEPDADLVIAMNKTLVNWVAKYPDWVKTFGAVLLDEGHHFPATTFAGPLLSFPARHRLAMTATPKRKDGKEVLMYDAFGSDLGKSKRSGKMIPRPRVLMEITDEDLDRYGRITPVDVVVVPTDYYYDLHLKDRMRADGFDPRDGESAMAAAKRFRKDTAYRGPLKEHGDMLDDMSRDAVRQARILEFLLPEIRADEVCLLLSDRRETSLDLYAWLKRRNIDVGRLMGGSQGKEQEATIRRLNAGYLKVAVGTTNIAGEGLNVKPLSCGFACTPTATNPGRLTQNVGRFKRKSEGKERATFYYFWDRLVSDLVRHARDVLNTIPQPHKVWYTETADRSKWRSVDRDFVKQLEKEARCLPKVARP